MPNDSDNYHPEFVPARLLSRDVEKLPCSVAASCGGCPEFAVSPAAQRELKARALLSGLAKRRVDYRGEVTWLASQSTSYRNRIRMALRGGIPSYFNDAKDPLCAVLEPSVLTALSAFQRWAPTYRQKLSNYCVAEVRARDADGKSAVYLRHTQRNGLSVSPPDWTWLPHEFDDILLAVEGGPIRLQRYMITRQVHAHIPIGGFMQINAGANRLIVQKVIDWATRSRVRSVLDLYSGSGNFSLPLAHAGCNVLAVEAEADACLALQLAAAEQSLSAITVCADDALSRASNLAEKGETFDLVVADPPRGGLRGNVDALCTMAHTAIILVSCDANRFCDDALALCDRGLLLDECVAVDMFPHTKHMEVLGLFLKQ